MISKRDKDQLFSLYENTIFIAKASDLSPDSTMSSNDEPVVKEPETDSQEVHMAKSDLLQIATDITALNEILKTERGLEGWVAAKITLAASYISSATDWLKYKSTQQTCDHDQL
jgi:hypothetical protein